MGESDPFVPNENWWPKSLQELRSLAPSSDSCLTVAEISSPWGKWSTFQTFSGLIDPRYGASLFDYLGGVGSEVKTSGKPHIVNLGEFKYTPRSWIDISPVVMEGVEPLTISWISANHSSLQVDQGFPLTYGLTPRFGNTDLEYWDDLEPPYYEVVVSKPVSLYSDGEHSRAFIQIDKDYLQDYSSIRQMTIFQVFYAERWTMMNEEAELFLGGKEQREVLLPGRRVRLLQPSYDRKRLHTQVSGVLQLLVPGESRITVGRWEYGELIWPGIDQPVTHDLAMSGELGVVYISDAILGEYEGRPEFTILPESGSVNYGNQWGTERTSRVGRDLIAVELKKLYEGLRPQVTRLWHRYAVPPPPADLRLRGAPNVAARTKRIAYELLSCGESLAELSSTIGDNDQGSYGFVRLNRQQLEFHGWWTFDQLSKVARHIPFDINRDTFLDRIMELNSLINEGFQEKPLRQLLLRIGIDPKEIEGFASIRLLEVLLKLAIISNETGLDLGEAPQEIIKRLSDFDFPDLPTEKLLALNRLRQLKGHLEREGDEEKFREAATALGVGESNVGWGEALDSVYDLLGQSLAQMGQTFGEVIS